MLSSLGSDVLESEGKEERLVIEEEGGERLQ